jgi:uncharacterized Zn finger protein (UPF0148 family)
MSLARDFVLMAKAKPRVTDQQPKVTYQGQTTFTKMCEACGFQTPHAHIDGKWQCVICDPSEDENVIRPAETHRMGGG